MKFKLPKNIFKYALSFGILVFIFLKMDMHALLEQSQRVSFFALLLSLVMMVCQVLFLNMRWHAFMNAGRKKVSFATASLINVAGCFANILFIASVGGIVAKSALSIRHGLSFQQALVATLLDRFSTLAALVVFSAISFPFLQTILDYKLSYMLGVSVVVVVVVCASFIIWLRSGFLKSYIMSSRKRSRMLAVLRGYGENYSLMVRVGGYSLIAQACFFVGVYVLSVGLSNETDTIWSVISFLALMPVLALIASLPISFGGWGVREGAFIYGLGLIGFSWEAAFLVSVQVGIVTMMAPFVVGLPYFLKYDMRAFFNGTHSKKVNG